MTASRLDILPDRLVSKIAVDPGTSCWVWTAAEDGKGYSAVKWEGRKRRAHRVTYELLVGPIPAGLTLDHLCRRPLCVNPGHLEPVTMRENLMRGFGPAARRSAQTHCIHGHEFTEANTWIKSNGTRMCRECNKQRTRRRRAAIREGTTR